MYQCCRLELLAICYSRSTVQSVNWVYMVGLYFHSRWHSVPQFLLGLPHQQPENVNNQEHEQHTEENLIVQESP